MGTQKRLYTTPRGGYITLISVLVVGAVGTAIGVSLLLLSLGAGRTSFSGEQSAQARAMAEGCAEEALQAVRDSAVCAGSSSLLFAAGSCDASVTVDDLLCRVEAAGRVGDVVKRTVVTLSSVSPLTIDSWQEVADF